MEFYICLDCGEAFRHPVRREEKHGEPHRKGEAHSVSPCCGGGYGEGATCVHCGREVLAVLNHKGLCVACVGSTVAKFERHLREEYSKEQLELLNEMFDGRPLDYLRPVASQR